MLKPVISSVINVLSTLHSCTFLMLTFPRLYPWSPWYALHVALIISLWCGVAQYGAAWLSMVRRGSVWCGVAHDGAAWLSYGAAWLIMVRRGSEWCGVAQLDGAAWLSCLWCGVAQIMVRRGSVGWCGVAQLLWCGVAQLVARRLAVRQARVRFSARHHREGLSH
jgi:hypothetical protein